MIEFLYDSLMLYVNAGEIDYLNFTSTMGFFEDKHGNSIQILFNEIDECETVCNISVCITSEGKIKRLAAEVEKAYFLIRE